MSMQHVCLFIIRSISPEARMIMLSLFLRGSSVVQRFTGQIMPEMMLNMRVSSRDLPVHVL